jgi:hypothetical protein
MANPAAAVTQSAVAVGLEDLRNGEYQHSHKLTASELMQHQQIMSTSLCSRKLLVLKV